MNIHEYQGKEILSSFGVTVQRGTVATTPQEAVEAAKDLTEKTGTGWHVIKAQVHAGGRGKGGGVKLAKNLKEVEEIAGEIIGMNLVTPQTSAEGKKSTSGIGSRRCLLSWRQRTGRILYVSSFESCHRKKYGDVFNRRRYGYRNRS